MFLRRHFAVQCAARPGAWGMITIAALAVMLLALPATMLAQTPPANGNPATAFDSPIVPPPTATTLPSPTPTETATPTPTATPDLSAAVLQVSPLALVPDDRPMDTAGPLPWLILAAIIVVAGSAVMVVAERRK